MASGHVVVFAGDPIQARRVWSALEGHGIGAKLLDDNLGSLAFPAAGLVYTKVVVAASDLDGAQDVLVAQGLVAPDGEDPQR